MNKAKELPKQDPRYQIIQNDFDMELARKTPLAAMIFIITSLIFFSFFRLEGAFNIINKSLCVVMIVLCIYRIYFCKKAVQGELEFNKYRRMIYMNIFLTTTLWTFIFGLMTFNVGFTDWRTVMTLAGFFGLGGGVPWTMAYARPLLFYMSLSWNGSQVLIVLYHFFFNNLQQSIVLSFLFYFIFFASYIIRQGLNYRAQLFEKAVGDMELDKANKELLESRQKIIEQTAMTQQANRLSALGEMAGGVAHEINTPLAAIQIRAENLLQFETQIQVGADKFKDEIKKIGVTVNRIAKIIQNLRTFARDSASDPFQSAKISLIIEDSMDLCREKFRNNGIHLQVLNLSDATIDCIPFQISQVLVNLLSNAFDAVKGTENPWVKINSFVNGEKVRVEVIDSGTGIPDDIAQKILQPFFTTKEVGSGTGLGLSVSKGIMDQHKGTLTYQNLNGHTCFAIELSASKSVN